DFFLDNRIQHSLCFVNIPNLGVVMSVTWTNFSAGFGDSSGDPTSDRSIVSDAEAIYRWILERRKSSAVDTHLERDGQELKTADS
ncbi:hypothetical protein NL533_33595, partial [Klebsiella pneumoniae]|nr:hypothetical protein [Klebsiella pneumoniae]